MTVVELKEKLIAKIKSTDNEELLEHIANIIDFERNTDEVYKLSPEEIAAVNEGIEQIKNRQYLSHEEANRQIEEWLKK